MIIFISLIFIAIMINVFNGCQDVGNSKTEIELAKSRRSQIVLIAGYKESDKKRRSNWHLMGLFTYGLFGVFGGLGDAFCGGFSEAGGEDLEDALDDLVLFLEELVEGLGVDA